MVKLRLILSFFLLTVCSVKLAARQNVALKDVVKVGLINSPDGFFGDPTLFRKYEITNENGNWISNKI
ncbi:hypothetical protein ACVWYN_003008 [Pedobacter sp. UYP24]